MYKRQVLANAPGAEQAEGEAALAAFYERWQHEALVVDKWLAVQASSRVPGTLMRVDSLTRHPAFDRKNPNKIYALLRTFGAVSYTHLDVYKRQLPHLTNIRREFLYTWYDPGNLYSVPYASTVTLIGYNACLLYTSRCV